MEDISGEYTLPEWIDSASQYHAREARARFEARALSLAKQAFWLELFAILRLFPEAKGARFTHDKKAERMIQIEPAPGASARRVLAAQRSLVSARGKFTGSQADEFRDHLRRVLPKGSVATLDQEDDILSRALGPHWVARRLAAREKEALSQELLPPSLARKESRL